MVTKHGQCIRFHEKDVQNYRTEVSMGVIGMNLSYDDEVVAMQLNTQGTAVAYWYLSMEWANVPTLNEFTPQHRGGKGIKCYKITEKTGNVVAAKAVNE